MKTPADILALSRFYEAMKDLTVNEQDAALGWLRARFEADRAAKAARAD